MYDSPFGSPKCSVVGLLAPVVVPLSRPPGAGPISVPARRPLPLLRKEGRRRRTERSRLKGKRNGTGKGGDLGTISMEALTKPWLRNLVSTPLGQFPFLVHSEVNEVYFYVLDFTGGRMMLKTYRKMYRRPHILKGIEAEIDEKQLFYGRVRYFLPPFVGYLNLFSRCRCPIIRPEAKMETRNFNKKEENTNGARDCT